MTAAGDPAAQDAGDIEAARKLFAGPCDFIIGATDLAQIPAIGLPEIALAGRSNVGKSSLLNALTARKALARVSNTPGRTRQLNFFALGELCLLVDMPGYGYAKVSQQQRREWDSLIFDYLRGRPSLRAVFVLVDARHGIKDSDRHLFDLLDRAAVGYRLVLTKADKAGPGGTAQALAAAAPELKKHPAAFPAALATSAHTGEGIDELRAAMRACAL